MSRLTADPRLGGAIDVSRVFSTGDLSPRSLAPDNVENVLGTLLGAADTAELAATTASKILERSRLRTEEEQEVAFQQERLSLTRLQVDPDATAADYLERYEQVMSDPRFSESRRASLAEALAGDVQQARARAEREQEELQARDRQNAVGIFNRVISETALAIPEDELLRIADLPAGEQLTATVTLFTDAIPEEYHSVLGGELGQRVLGPAVQLVEQARGIRSQRDKELRQRQEVLGQAVDWEDFLRGSISTEEYLGRRITAGEAPDKITERIADQFSAALTDPGNFAYASQFAQRVSEVVPLLASRPTDLKRVNAAMKAYRQFEADTAIARSAQAIHSLPSPQARADAALLEAQRQVAVTFGVEARGRTLEELRDALPSEDAKAYVGQWIRFKGQFDDPESGQITALARMQDGRNRAFTSSAALDPKDHLGNSAALDPLYAARELQSSLIRLAESGNAPRSLQADLTRLREIMADDVFDTQEVEDLARIAWTADTWQARDRTDTDLSAFIPDLVDKLNNEGAAGIESNLRFLDASGANLPEVLDAYRQAVPAGQFIALTELLTTPYHETEPAELQRLFQSYAQEIDAGLADLGFTTDDRGRIDFVDDPESVKDFNRLLNVLHRTTDEGRRVAGVNKASAGTVQRISPQARATLIAASDRDARRATSNRVQEAAYERMIRNAGKRGIRFVENQGTLDVVLDPQGVTPATVNPAELQAALEGETFLTRHIAQQIAATNPRATNNQNIYAALGDLLDAGRFNLPGDPEHRRDQLREHFDRGNLRLEFDWSTVNPQLGIRIRLLGVVNDNPINYELPLWYNWQTAPKRWNRQVYDPNRDVFRGINFSGLAQ